MLILVCICLLIDCEKLEIEKHVIINTGEVTNTTPNTALVLGVIIDVGETGLIQHGHCWSASEIPTVSLDTKTELGSRNSKGTFNDILTNLEPNTAYYVRSYAISKSGTYYGASISFTTDETVRKSCLFISMTADPDTSDVELVEWLREKYIVDVIAGGDVNSYGLDYFQQYDFIFVSESIHSNDTRILKGAPVPMFYTELWSSKWDVTGWVPINESPTYYGNTPESIIKIVNENHELSAGYGLNSEIALVSRSHDGLNFLTYSVPQVEHIRIGVLASDESKVVVMGVEKGTVLYNAENVKDGSFVSQSRVAAVGISFAANTYMTDDAFNLIDAGINWILSEENK